MSDQTQTPSGPKPQERTERNRNRFFAWLWRFAHRRFPKIVPIPDIKDDLRWHWERDSAENDKTTPPADEKVELRCLWAAEFYTPTHAESVIRSFQRLGWEKKSARYTRSGPVKWLLQTRRLGHGGGWINLGALVPPKQKRRYWGDTYETALPEHVDHATAHLFNITSSITCLVICFVYSEDYQSIYDDVLRKRRKSYAETLRPFSWTIHEPEGQKRTEISDIRRALRSNAAAWFRRHAPGLFTSTEKIVGFPTCEFVMLNDAEPFPSGHTQPDNIRMMLDILDMNFDYYSWTSTSIPGLKFTWPLPRGDSDPFHTCLAARKNDLAVIDMKGWGSAEKPAYVARIDLEIKTLLSRWACISVLRTYEEKLAEARDSYKGRYSKHPLKFLLRLRNIVSESVDVAAITPDLITFAGSGGLFRGDMFDFVMSPGMAHGHTQTALNNGLRERIVEYAKKLQDSDKSLKELFIQHGNLLAAYENIKLQRVIYLLTGILTVLTALMAYDSLSKIDIRALQNWLYGLW